MNRYYEAIDTVSHLLSDGIQWYDLVAIAIILIILLRGPKIE